MLCDITVFTNWGAQFTKTQVPVSPSEKQTVSCVTSQVRLFLWMFWISHWGSICLEGRDLYTGVPQASESHNF